MGLKKQSKVQLDAVILTEHREPPLEREDMKMQAAIAAAVIFASNVIIAKDYKNKRAAK